MASEIRVNKIINRSGLSTVTFSDTGAIVSGIVTANSFSGNVTGNVTGSGANLTSIPAGQLTGTVADARLTTVSSSKLSGALPALDGSALTGINTAFGSGTSVNTSGIITATAFVSDTPLSNRNIIVNGGCIVAQRGTSSTSTGYGSVDRMQMVTANTDQLAFAQKQTSDGPDGFSKCWEFDVTTIENAVDADEIIYMRYLVEAQDLRPLYNANGTGKNFTLSFYVKAAQTGTYNIGIHKSDGGTRFITNTYTISAANTWQRVVWNITGDTGTTGMAFDNGQGFQISFMLAAGTNYTSGGVQSSWGGFSNSLMAGGHAVNVVSSTDNYWRITGIQLEIGSVATPFEHRKFGEELSLCQRYCYDHLYPNANQYASIMLGTYYMSSRIYGSFRFPVTMRTAPTMVCTDSADAFNCYRNGGVDFVNEFHIDSSNNVGPNGAEILNDTDASGTAGDGVFIRRGSNSTTTFRFEAEL